MFVFFICSIFYLFFISIYQAIHKSSLSLVSLDGADAMVTWTQCVIYGLPGFGFGAVTVARIRATWGHGWENDLSGCLWRICGEFLGRLKLPFFQSGSNNSAEFKTSRADSSHWSRRSEWWGGFTMFHPCQQCKLAPFSHFQRHKFQLANHKISSVANPMPRTSINNLLGMVYKFIPWLMFFIGNPYRVRWNRIKSYKHLRTPKTSQDFLMIFMAIPSPKRSQLAVREKSPSPFETWTIFATAINSVINFQA